MKPKLEDTRGCWNYLVRRTARIVSRHFDDALRPHGIRSTQFNVMSALAQTGPITVSQLAEVLAMERSALARNLKPLQRQGFISITQGSDKRTRQAVITAKGTRKLNSSLSDWSTAQRELEKLVGTREAKQFSKIVTSLGSKLSDR